MNKERLIQEFLNEPIKVGDIVTVRGLGSQNKVAWGSSTEVKEVHKDLSITIYDYSDKVIKVEDYKKYTGNIGYSPIVNKHWDSSLCSILFGLSSIFTAMNFNYDNGEFETDTLDEGEVFGCEWDSFFVNKKGEDVVYQRDFCWELKDKQLLIESIYNNIDIGKIILRSRSYEWARDRLINNKTASFKEIIDGKQRLEAIISFVQNKYPDLNGYYWKDFSKQSKRRFLDFRALSYGEVGEKGTDEDVKSIFLAVNFTGRVMSQDHIDYVKNLTI